MIPSWRKRKAQERKARCYPQLDTTEGHLMGHQGYDQTIPDREFIGGLYCPNCGHRYGRVGHRFACGGRTYRYWDEYRG
jgi:hypothetical protein